MKSKIFLFSGLFLSIATLLPQTSFAQFTAPPIINATPLPVGSGARAIGQGGAFISVADDATAASWNPGALIQLEKPELSFVGSFLSTQQDFTPGGVTPDGVVFNGFDKEFASRGDLNFASIAYPFRVFGKNLVAALNYHQVYDFGMKQDFNNPTDIDIPPPIDFSLHMNNKIAFESKGGVAAFTPAIAVMVIPRLSLGVAVNVFRNAYNGDIAWKETTWETGKGAFGNSDGLTPFTDTIIIEQTFKDYKAFNVSVGLHWDVWEKEEKRLTFGAVFHSPYTAGVDRVTDLKFGFNGSLDTFPSETHHFKINYPMSIGAGLGFRYNDALTLAMDMTWTDWSVFQQEDENGNKTRPLGGAPPDRHISDTYSVRTGGEYLIFRQKVIIPVRGGLFYDPRVSLDKPTDVYGFSVGSGISTKRISIDGAYQFRWSPDAKGEDFGLPGIPVNLREHLFMASIIVYF